MVQDPALHDEYAIASEGMAASACKAALQRLRELCDDRATVSAVRELHHLTSYARQVGNCLEAGQRAIDLDKTDDASLQWARALVLMNAMAVEASGGRTRMARSLPHQKSGKAS